MPYVDYTTEEVKTAVVKVGNVEVMVAVEPDHAAGQNTLYAYAYDSYLEDYTQDQVTIYGYPIDFNKYELIEGVKMDGTQYCKTDVVANDTYKLTVDFMFSTTGTQYVCGSTVSGKSMYVSRGSSYLKGVLGNQSKNITPVPAVDVRIVVVVDVTGITVNGTLTAWDDTVAAFTATRHLGIGAALNTSDGPTTNNFKGVMYRMQVYDTADSSVVAEFVPVKRRSDGVVGFYDLVNGGFYSSIGTNPFEEV